MIGIYIIQAVSGSIAVILTVPLVAFFSAQLIPALAAPALAAPALGGRNEKKPLT